MSETIGTPTFLYDNHTRRGAKLVNFGGYQLPVWFSNLKDEHFAVRERAGVFDISHMGVLVFSGPNARNFVQKVSCNNLEKHQSDKMIYSMILNEDGGVLDDVMMATLDDDVIMVVNASNTTKLLAWFDDVGLDGTQLTSVSETHGFIAVQGPESLNQISSVLDISFQDTSPFSVWRTSVLQAPCIIMRTGYTGEIGCEIAVPKEHLSTIWDALIDGGITPCGLGARDTLRLEAGFPLYGQELSEKITPLMTRYKWVLDWNKDFIGKKALLDAKEKTLEWTTVGLELLDKGIARTHYPIKEGGEVTSGTMSPSLEKCIAMALVKPEYAELGTVVHVDVRGRECRAKVVPIPF